jgi:hypothetical protein
VGGWLVLNVVVFTALMLRRDRPVLRNRLFRWVVGDEVHDRLGDLAASSDVVGHVAGPALGDVESDDADWRRIPAFEQMADQHGAIPTAPGIADPAAEIVEDKTDRPIEVAPRDNRR